MAFVVEPCDRISFCCFLRFNGALVSLEMPGRGKKLRRAEFREIVDDASPGDTACSAFLIHNELVPADYFEMHPDVLSVSHVGLLKNRRNDPPPNEKLRCELTHGAL